MPDKVSLACREGSADKVYYAEIVPVLDGFQINTSHGRRGGTMTAVVHKDTLKPVPYITAKKIFDKLVKSKLAKDPPYKIVDTEAPKYLSTGNQQVPSGYKPQLLNAIEEADVEMYFKDPAYMMQEKMDGERRMAKKLGGDIFGINRKGEVVPLPEQIAAEMRKLPDCVLDGEQVGDILFGFDCLERDGEDLRSRTAEVRYFAAQDLGSATGAGVQIIRAFATESGKRKAFAEIKARKGEGVVFKLRDSVYVAGRPNSKGPQVKFKFTASATCAVLSQNGSKRSAGLGIRQGSSEQWVPIGNVTIPANFPIPPAGALVEVRYLYAYPGGALYQPVYLGPRTDQTLPDDVSTLKFKQGTDDDDTLN
jgi:bifunctional non-homologous end joining protein LigD